jgi:sortase A
MGSTIEPVRPSTARQGRPRHQRRLQLSGKRRVLREIGYGLMTAGLVVLLFIAYQLWGTGLVEANSQRHLRQQFDNLVSRPPAPTASSPTGSTGPAPPIPSPPTGGAVVHLVIPKIGVDKFVVEGVDPAELRKGPGHYPQTPFPGEQGNAAIAGHRTTYGAPFYRLNQLHPGDDIYATTASGRFHYRVSQSNVVKPSDVSVLDPTHDNRLTLTTCTPRYSASRRLVVVSQLTSIPAGGPPPSSHRVAPVGAVARAAPVHDLGTGDTAGWPPTILFGLVALGL